jgi:hypothetical protein
MSAETNARWEAVLDRYEARFGFRPQGLYEDGMLTAAAISVGRLDELLDSGRVTGHLTVIERRMEQLKVTLDALFNSRTLLSAERVEDAQRDYDRVLRAVEKLRRSIR